MTDLLERYPLAAFFVLAFAGSWLLWSPWWLSLSGVGLLPYELPFGVIALINQLGLFAGPFAAAFLLTRRIEGKDGVNRLWQRIFQWRVRSLWYVVALVAIPIATGLGYLFQAEGAGANGVGGVTTLSLVASTFFYYLLGGPLQEEPGWRGFALPRMQRLMQPLSAAIVLGVIHCFWHAPLFLTTEWDTARQDPGQYLAYLILVVSLSVILSWVSNGSGGSVLLAILGHNSLNWALFTAGILLGQEVTSNWPAAIGLSMLAILVILLTRGRLAYSESGSGRSA